MRGARLEGEPVFRILGEKEFWGLSFKLNAATLVPRPETELLVEKALEIDRPARPWPASSISAPARAASRSRSSPNISDITAVAVDLAPEALEMARFNANRHGVGTRFTTLQGSWFDPLEPGERFDLITSNPPYIETAEIGTLMVEVREHDPRLALDGGADGLAAYRAIASEASLFLKPDGVLLLEIGAGQGQSVSDILVGAGFQQVEISQDLGGHDRVILARITPDT